MRRITNEILGMKGFKWGNSLYFNDKNILMLSNVNKNCDENLIL